MNSSKIISITPSFTSLSTSGQYTASASLNSTNTTVVHTTLVKASVISTSSVLKASTTVGFPASSSGSNTPIFEVVFYTAVALALLVTFSFFMIIACWSARRKRSADMTEKKHRSHGLRHSLKRTYALDGPLYAVTTLIGRRYTQKREGKRNEALEISRSSVEIDITGRRSMDNISSGEMTMNNKIYERYLTPVDGLPGENPVSSAKNPEDEPAYLEPVGGIPVPDGTQPGTAVRPPQEEVTDNSAVDVTNINNKLYDQVSPVET